MSDASRFQMKMMESKHLDEVQGFLSSEGQALEEFLVNQRGLDEAQRKAVLSYTLVVEVLMVEGVQFKNFQDHVFSREIDDLTIGFWEFMRTHGPLKLAGVLLRQAWALCMGSPMFSHIRKDLVRFQKIDKPELN